MQQDQTKITNKHKRGPNVVQHPYLLRDMYVDYIKDKERNSPYWVSLEDYQNICGIYYKELMSKMIMESKVIKLPFRMGNIHVGKRKPAILSGAKTPLEYPMNALGIDWKESKRLGKWVRYINDHTDGFKYRFFWSKKTCMVVNREFYRLVFSRANKRLLASVIKSGVTDYLEL